jgi:hypothetical protein
VLWRGGRIQEWTAAGHPRRALGAEEKKLLDQSSPRTFVDTPNPSSLTPPGDGSPARIVNSGGAPALRELGGAVNFTAALLVPPGAAGGRDGNGSEDGGGSSCPGVGGGSGLTGVYVNGLWCTRLSVSALPAADGGQPTATQLGSPRESEAGNATGSAPAPLRHRLRRRLAQAAPAPAAGQLYPLQAPPPAATCVTHYCCGLEPAPAVAGGAVAAAGGPQEGAAEQEAFSNAALAGELGVSVLRTAASAGGTPKLAQLAGPPGADAPGASSAGQQPGAAAEGEGGGRGLLLTVGVTVSVVAGIAVATGSGWWAWRVQKRRRRVAAEATAAAAEQAGAGGGEDGPTPPNEEARTWEAAPASTGAPPTIDAITRIRGGQGCIVPRLLP